MTSESKTCARCKHPQPLEDFNDCALTHDGKQAYCRACRNAYMRAWKKNNRDKTREWTRQYRAAMRERKSQVEPND